jgi:O-antigen ligase/polysaccharide polymerase Wzy-like membrane protein
MVRSPAMPVIREPPLAASLLLVGLALFFGGAAENGSLWWLGGGALVALVALAATRGLPHGWLSLAPLAALVGWVALSISWSWLPDRSWDYADRGFVYLLFAALGLWLVGHTRELAVGLMALFGALLAWSLLGKILPPVYDYGPPGVARLQGPVGLWNQLALVAVFALPLALWRKRLAGTLLAYLAIVALLLTYSRGGLLTAVLVLVAWFALSGERLDSAATLVAAAVPAGVVVGVAFVLPGVTSDGQSSSTRWRDGLIFGAVLIAGAGAAALLARAPRPRDTPQLRRILIATGVVGAIAVIVVGALKVGSFTSTSSVGNSSARFSSGASNFRWAWWQQAWDGWQHAKLVGTGAGTFLLTNLRYRDSYLDQTIEPHNLPLQFLLETGVIGLVLLLLAVAFLLRPSWRRRGHELALALLLPAYLVHSLVDVDWDFAAVSVPAFLAAGSLAGRLPFRRVPPFAIVALAGAAALGFGTLLLPWLGERWANDALFASPSRAVQLANRAESVDPLLVEPLWAKALAAGTRGEEQRAFDYYVEAVRRQPKNPQTWLFAGRYALDQRCYHLAYTYLEKFTELNQKARPSAGGDDYNRALRLVDAGKGKC